MKRLLLFLYFGFFMAFNSFSSSNQSIEIKYKHSLRIPYNKIDIKLGNEKNVYYISVHTRQMKEKTGHEDTNRNYKIIIDKDYFDNLYMKLINLEYREILIKSENIISTDGNEIQLTVGTPQNNLRINIWNPSYQSDSRKTNVLYEIIKDIFEKVGLKEWV